MKKNLEFLFSVSCAVFLTFSSIHAKPRNIPARYGHSAIYDSANQQMLIFGGSHKGALAVKEINETGGILMEAPIETLSDLWVYDIEKKTWKELEIDEAPEARVCHRAIYDSENKQMVVFGGSGNKSGYLYDTWVFDIDKKTWEEIEIEAVPRGRFEPSAVYDFIKKQMIIFGGYSNPGIENGLSDVWIFDIQKKRWKEAEPDKSPLPRWGHTAVYDPMNKQMLIFGGYSTENISDDLWSFDCDKEQWTKIETEDVPPARYSHSAIYDPINKQMLVFGGSSQNANRYLSDTWVFDIEKKTWKELETKKAPAARTRHSAIYDSANKQMLIFGGAGETGEFSDVWSFSVEKKTWNKIKVEK